METELYITEKQEPESFAAEVLEIYERAGESTRMDMYMTYRELRKDFNRIEVGSGTRQ